MVPECGGVVLSARHGARVWWCCAEFDVVECVGVVSSVMVWCQSVVVLC